MRTEQEMFDLILSVARRDARVRAVYMNGSRANPNAPRDCLQDYDIVYIVTETLPMVEDTSWLNAFGTPLLAQDPHIADTVLHGAPVDASGFYNWLLLFDDGNRMDLSIETWKSSDYGADSATLPLLDKEGLLPPIPPASDADYRTRRPEEPLYRWSCNHFWWCMQNVAKGLWRGELPYAWSMLCQVVLPELDRQVEWYIGLLHDFSVNPGKMGRYFERFLAPPLWAQYRAAHGGMDGLWESVFAACGLFCTLSQDNAERMGFVYTAQEADNMLRYLRAVRALPRGARTLTL